MHHKVTSFSGAEPLKTDSSVIGWVGKAHGPSQNFGGPLTKLRIKPPARDSRYTNFVDFAASLNARDAMVVKIRLARFGRTNAPFYNIVVAHARYAAETRLLYLARDSKLD